MKRWRWLLLAAALLALMAFGLHPTEQAQRTKAFLGGAEYPYSARDPGCGCGVAP
jgi:hypothetical protein